MAERLTKGDQEVVPFDPKRFWKQTHQGGLRLFGRFCLYKPKTVRNPVDVRIHADGRNPKPLPEDERGRFLAHAGQRQKLLFGTWDVPVVPLLEDACYLLELPCLLPVEPYGVDQARDFGLIKLKNLFNRGRRLKQARKRPVSGFILRPEA